MNRNHRGSGRSAAEEINKQPDTTEQHSIPYSKQFIEAAKSIVVKIFTRVVRNHHDT